eukprot:scaffold9894_cov118-Isochrysis_galbana.AAC.2
MRHTNWTRKRAHVETCAPVCTYYNVHAASRPHSLTRAGAGAGHVAACTSTFSNPAAPPRVNKCPSPPPPAAASAARAAEPGGPAGGVMPNAARPKSASNCSRVIRAARSAPSAVAISW